MSRLTIPLALALLFPGAPCLAQCVDYGSYLHWAGFVPLPGQPEQLAADGDRVYMAAGATGLLIINASDPSALILADTLDTPGTCLDVRVASGYALVADGSGGLLTVNPGPPAAVVNTLNLGSPSRLDVRNGKAVTVGGGVLSVLDVSNPLSPSVLGSRPLSASVWKVKLTETHAFIACTDSLRIVDITNPVMPVQVGAFDATGSYGCLSVDVQGNYAYMLDILTGFEQSWVRILDVSNPATPVEVSQIYIYAFAFDLSLSGDRLFLTGSSTGDLVEYDISDPLNVELSSWMSFEYPSRRHVRSGSRIYVQSGYAGNEPRTLHVIENIDSGTPPVDFSLPIPTAASLLVRGDRAYATGRYPGLAMFRIIDVSQSATPIDQGGLTLGSIGLYRPIGLDARDNLVFMTGHSNGLYVIDVTNAAAPALIRQVDTAGEAGAVVLIGDYAYVADGPNGLAIIDISVPGTAFLAGQFAVPGDAVGLAQVGNLLYVMAREEGIQVLDLVSPLAPTIVGSLTTDYAQDLFVDGPVGYLADGYIGGLRILDLADPLNPAILGRALTPGSAEKVTASGPYAYVGDGTEGVAVIDVQDSAHPRFVGSHLGVGGKGLAPVGPFLYVCDDSNGQLAVLGRQCVPTAVPETGAFPIGLSVSPAFPNPSRGPVALRFRLEEPGQVRVNVVDVRGARVRALADGLQPAGEGTLTWDGLDDHGIEVPAGVYFINVKAGAEFANRRIVRLR